MILYTFGCCMASMRNRTEQTNIQYLHNMLYNHEPAAKQHTIAKTICKYNKVKHSDKNTPTFHSGNTIRLYGDLYFVQCDH